ncbi:MAG: hypothetical protein JRI23_16505 [Deltaproteobacteria bacterium]|jgi:hypothetical protein|nr:hypothetical protein [Deltaproteobacteria bacterium]MBW2533378.1 hypothetical protein [Deltaproteobacteria bacterium]
MSEPSARRLLASVCLPVLLLGVGAGACAEALGIEDKDLAPEWASGEQCDNGLDDDGDEQIDCADPDCSGYVCTPAVPPGWTGPASIGIDPGESPCPTGQVEVLQIGLGEPVATPAECEPCECTPTDIGCDAEVAVHYDGSCSGQTGTELLDANCLDWSSSGDPAAKVISFTPHGSCSASGGEEVLPRPAVSFGSEARLCQSAAGGGCADQGACSARPVQPFVGPCVYRLGEVPCPDGAYQRQVLVSAVTGDDRRCTPCSCPASPDCSQGVIELYDQSDCSGSAVGTIPLDGSCAALPSQSFDGARVVADPAEVCSPAGGEGTTDVSFSTLTVCCTS